MFVFQDRNLINEIKWLTKIRILSEIWEGGSEQLVSHSNEAVIENVIPNEGDGDTPNTPPTYSDHSYLSSNTEMRTRSLPASTLIRAQAC